MGSSTKLDHCGLPCVQPLRAHSQCSVICCFPWLPNLSLFFIELLLLKRKTVTKVPQNIRSNLPLKCLKKPILILNQPWQCCIVILPYFVAKKGGKEIKKFALLSSFLVSWSLTSVYIGRRKPVQNNGYIGLKSFLKKHFNDNA